MKCMGTYFTPQHHTILHMELNRQLKVLSLSPSFLIGLPKSRFRVCNTYIAWTSDVRARLGLKAAAWARLLRAWACQISSPSLEP